MILVITSKYLEIKNTFEPDKSYTGVLNVRLTPNIHRQIAMLALQAGVSINAYIKDALEEKVEEAVAV